jgi:hypothetical protein
MAVTWKAELTTKRGKDTKEFGGRIGGGRRLGGTDEKGNHEWTRMNTNSKGAEGKL